MMTDDELDLRLRRWFADGPSGLSADALDGVTASIADRPQRRAARPMPRRLALGWLVAAAVVIATLVAARLLTMPDVASPSPSALPSPSSQPSQEGIVVPLGDPVPLDGRWSTIEAASGGLPSGRWELSLGDWAVVTKPSFDGGDAPTYALWLRPVTISGNQIRIAAPVGAACVGQAATYLARLDGEDALRLSPVEDDCQERRDALAGRTWTRAWAGSMLPDRTYVTDAAPVSVALTVPATVPALDATTEPMWFTHLATAPGSKRFVVVSVIRQLTVDACDLRRSYRVVEEMTAADVADHLSAQPPLEVMEREDVTFDGHRAIRLRIRVGLEAAQSCHLGVAVYWADPGTSVLVTTGGAQQGQQSTGGTTEEMYLIDVDGEVVAISAQAPTANFEDWLTTIGPMVTTAKIIDR